MTISLKINLTAKQKIFVVSALFLGLVIAIFVWIIVPVVKDIQKLNQQIYDQRLALEKKYVQRFSMRRVIKDFREIHENMDKILSIFLPQNGEISFITELEERADQNELDLKIYFLPEEKKDYPDGKQKFDLTLTVEGGFKNIVNFIRDIEKLDTYILINSVSLTQSSGKEDNIIGASLKGYVYKNINL